eukprot:8387015-Pyramimonas_sp.AAC.1
MYQEEAEPLFREALATRRQTHAHAHVSDHRGENGEVKMHPEVLVSLEALAGLLHEQVGYICVARHLTAGR